MALGAWRRFNAALGPEMMQVLLSSGLTMPQVRALGAVRRARQLSGRELAAALRVTPGSVVPLCDRLEEQGLLERVPDREDRRVTWLKLTAEGEMLFRRLWMAGGRRLMVALRSLEPADRRAFIRVLDLLADGVESDREQPNEVSHEPG
jgi:DNA-binding MarR family transcriptional regulator